MQKENTPEKMNEEAEDFVAPKQKKASKRKMDIDSSEKVNIIILGPGIVKGTLEYARTMNCVYAKGTAELPIGQRH